MEKLSKQQINEFQQKEAELDSSTDDRYKLDNYIELAQDVTLCGNESELKLLKERDWARKLLVKAEQFAIDFFDYKQLADAIAFGDILGEWMTSEWISDGENNRALYEGVSVSKNDKDWSRKLYKKAEKLLVELEDEWIANEMLNLATSIDQLYNYFPVFIEKDVEKDKKWALKLRANAVKIFLKNIKVNPEKATIEQVIDAYVKLDK